MTTGRRLLLMSLVSVFGLVLSFPMMTSPVLAQGPLYYRSMLGKVGGNGAIVLGVQGDQNAVQGYLEASEPVLIQGRDDAGTWLRVYSSAGYGYVQRELIEPTGDPMSLPAVPPNLPTEILPPAVPVADGGQYPILPSVTGFSREIYQKGLALGNRPQVFTKAGDCLSDDPNKFLGRVGQGNYDLGTYAYLQDVVNYYLTISPKRGAANSFIANSLATYNGYTAAYVVDPTWLRGGRCPAKSSPLTCEFYLTKPSLVIVMFGANDANVLTPAQFDFFLRVVVHTSIDNGVVPLLSTFPGTPRSEARTHQFNQIIYSVAREYDVPIMNLWLALQALPNGGREAGTMYLSLTPKTRVTHFTDENLQYGYTMRNLVTLQSLDILWRGLIGG